MIQATHLVTVDDGHKAKDKAAKKGSEDGHHQVVLWLVLCIDNSWCWWTRRLHNLHGTTQTVDTCTCGSYGSPRSGYLWCFAYMIEQPMNRLSMRMPSYAKSPAAHWMAGNCARMGPWRLFHNVAGRDYVPACSTPLLTKFICVHQTHCSVDMRCDRLVLWLHRQRVVHVHVGLLAGSCDVSAMYKSPCT